MQAQLSSFFNAGARAVSQAATGCTREIQRCANNFKLMPEGKAYETVKKAAIVGAAVGILAIAVSNPILVGVSAATFVLYKSTHQYSALQAAGDHLSDFGNGIVRGFSNLIK